ncbi:hypothetical protein D3Z51_04605 [Clostridiaceae bacterium]|nr:hypothetical protein [Clostridiaceae bacterium]RKI09748.1 hypothetical protein D7V81_16875 [bacterium 1XD21-70]
MQRNKEEQGGAIGGFPCFFSLCLQPGGTRNRFWKEKWLFLVKFVGHFPCQDGIPLAFSDKNNYNEEISKILRKGGFFYGERTYG